MPDDSTRAADPIFALHCPRCRHQYYATAFGPQMLYFPGPVVGIRAAIDRAVGRLREGGEIPPITRCPRCKTPFPTGLTPNEFTDQLGAEL